MTRLEVSDQQQVECSLCMFMKIHKNRACTDTSALYKEHPFARIDDHFDTSREHGCMVSSKSGDRLGVAATSAPTQDPEVCYASNFPSPVAFCLLIVKSAITTIATQRYRTPIAK